MRIVVDLGCRDLGGPDSSLEPLREEFHPALLYGFDPNCAESVWYEDGTLVLVSAKAAWYRGGQVPWSGETYRAHVPVKGELSVPCFHFSEWLQALPRCELVVKMNIEGAEYPLLADMHGQGTDALVDLLIVQWHTGELANGWDERRPELRCREVREWHGACV